MENIEKPEFLFGKKNYTVMIIGIIVIALGFVFMSGGGSNNPQVFKYNKNKNIFFNKDYSENTIDFFENMIL